MISLWFLATRGVFDQDWAPKQWIDGLFVELFIYDGAIISLPTDEEIVKTIPTYHRIDKLVKSCDLIHAEYLRSGNTQEHQVSCRDVSIFVPSCQNDLSVSMWAWNGEFHLVTIFYISNEGPWILTRQNGKLFQETGLQILYFQTLRIAPPLFYRSPARLAAVLLS